MADFTERFNELLARSAENDTTIAEALGVSKQSISAWKNGVRFPKRPMIRTIANYFHVGVPWLEGVTDDETAGIESTSDRSNYILDSNEIELLSIFRTLNDFGQQTLMGTARSLGMNPDMQKNGASNSETA